MTRSSNQPRLLTAVMEAIANLKEGRGSTQKKIIDQVQCLLNANKMTFRNPAVHIKKALRHGVQTGLIKQKGGKFRLGLDSKDYAIFKNFQKLRKKKDLPLREHRRGRRRRKSKRRRRRRRRRSRNSADEYESGSGSATESHLGTPDSNDARRGRKGGRGKRRREEREWSSEHASSENKEISPSVSNENTRAQGKADRDREREREGGRDRDRDMDEDNCEVSKYEEDDVTCDNPGCLCNLKRNL